MRKKARKKQKDKRKVQNAVSLKVGDNTFKSKLELFTYNKLLEAGIKDFKYEEMKFTILEGFEFNNDSIEAYDRTIDRNKVKIYDTTTNSIRPITYLPDFTCIDEETKTGWLLECKGYPNEGLKVSPLV